MGLAADEIVELLKGNPPDRTDNDNKPSQKAKPSVPVTKKGDEESGDLEPQPQN